MQQPPTQASPIDPYAVTAAAYDLFAMVARDEQITALGSLLPHIDVGVGPILDVGAGSGSNTAYLLEHLPDAHVLALEPSSAMRSLLLSKLAAHPEWFPRVTVQPESFFSATLPEHVAGALLLGVLGHFDPTERAALLAELAARLPEGGKSLIDLQHPERPQRVAPYEFSVAQIGELSYRGIAQAWPLDNEQMRWEMTYLTLEGERILVEDIAEYVYRHPSPETVRAEAKEVGLSLTRLGDSTHWILSR